MPEPKIQRRKHSSLSQYLAEEIPIIVPCFNNVTYVRSMVSQLRDLGLRNIMLVDNNSDFPPMTEYLAHPGDGVRTVLLKENLGPRNAVADAFNFQMLPDVFCVTDPDLEFNIAMPDNFLAQTAIYL